MAQQPAWLQEMVRKVAIAVAMAPISDGKRERRGPALVARDRGDDWFRIRTRLRASDLDQMDDALLAPRSGPEDESYAIVEADVDDGTLYVRAPAAVATDELFLFTRKPSARRLRQALHDGLSTIRDGTPADAFGRERLGSLPPPGPTPPGYSPDQARALDACCAPGLQMVWGPPGTGKTHVITGAISRFLRQGRRVLLVSSTNVAVDNAVQRVVAALSAETRAVAPGEVVRVGTPHLHDVAADPRVSLARLVADRLATTQANLERLGKGVSSLRTERHAAETRLEQARSDLASFDVDAYRRADERRRQHEEVQTAEARAMEWQQALAESDAALATARHRVLRARFHVAYLEEHAKSAVIEMVERDLAALASRRGLGRLLALPKVKAARAQRDRSLWEKTEATTVRQRLQGELSGAVTLEHIPPPWTAAFADLDVAARQELMTAEETGAAAERHVVASRRHADQAETYVLRLRATAGDGPSPDDLRLLEDAERRGLPSLRAQLPMLSDDLRTASQQYAELTEEMRQVAEEAKRERVEVEQRVIAEARVVATTLAMSMMKKAVGLLPYDHVIVDEVAAASLPEVVNAVGRATEGACLLGDYLQNGPIVDADIERSQTERAAVHDLFAVDCFRYFGLTDPARASRTEGCVVLTEQRRFGETITDLANRVAYDGILSRATPTDPDAARDEVVFVDVNGLGTALTTVRREGSYRGSWPVGALLARALGDHHLSQGHSVGVVTPYREQARTTAAFLDETDEGMRIDVGTSHAFQGREFDVVIFDTLENGEARNGRRLGWVGQGTRHTRNEWLLGGLRLFNVAVTRARRRLYLIGAAAALEAATTGPLAHVRDLVTRGAVKQVRARDLLGRAGPSRPVEGSVEHDLQAALGRFVRVVDVYDQHRVLDRVRQRIDGARHSVWVWSPWVGRHATGLQGSLSAAHARGVDVFLVALPEEQVTESLRESLAALRDELPHLVLQHRTHQKIVVVDERWTLLGSMNLLSHARRPSDRRQEIMVEVESGQFAERVLWHERADDLRDPPRCATCGEQMWHAHQRQRPRPGWYWFCGRVVNGTKCQRAEPFRGASGSPSRR